MMNLTIICTKYSDISDRNAYKTTNVYSDKRMYPVVFILAVYALKASIWEEVCVDEFCIQYCGYVIPFQDMKAVA